MQYDYVVDRGNGFEKVQVKSVYFDKSRKKYRCDLRKSKPRGNNKERYKEGDFDLLAISVSINKWVLIPWCFINENSEINLSDRRIQNELSWHFSFEQQDI